MTKAETLKEAKAGKGCLGRSQDDEPIFVIAARDSTSVSAVRRWAWKAATKGAPAAKVGEALCCAAAMHKWQKQNGRKDPD